MKTELLFRGLRKDGEGFAYGDRVQGASGKVYIFDYDDIVGNSHIHEVIPESVGQFTGLTDKNGVKVFEGDKFEDTGESGYLLVEWNDEESRFQLNVYDFPMSYGEGSQEIFGSEIERVDENVIDMSCISEFEVIGNIHEPCKQY